MDSNVSNIINLEDTSGSIKSFGKFQAYPAGIFNPAFCGMMLWEIAPNHILNDYKICQFHQIKSGIILYGHNAYIFTPITNNDIQSYLKILICGKSLKHNLPACKVAKNLYTMLGTRLQTTLFPVYEQYRHT